MTSFLLVHGAFHGPWCWDSIFNGLVAEGHSVVAPRLPGREDTASRAAQVTLDDQVKVLDAALRDCAEPPLVVAHSLGGLAASTLAEIASSRIAGLIYVNGVVPLGGSSLVSTMFDSQCASILLEADAVQVHPDQTVSIDAKRARRAFYSRCADDVAKAAAARLCREPLQPLLTPVSLGPLFDSIPKTYIGGTDDRAIPPQLQHFLAAAIDARFLPIASDHSPFYSAPDALISALRLASR
jgi:pimeloyl-ACP methyl ester carboxylesterase